MALGTGAPQASTLPSEPFDSDPDGFFQMTRKNVATFETVPVAAADLDGYQWERQLPQTGIAALLTITATAEMTVAAGGATAGPRFPYGLVDTVALKVNGQNMLWSCRGEDLHVLRDVRYPAYAEQVDTFPAAVGGGAVAAGTYDLSLTWEIPIAVDMTSLVGSLYLQSGATTAALQRTLAGAAKLFSADASRVTFANISITTEITRFSVPRRPDANGVMRLVIPDLSKLHGFNAVDLPVGGIGDQRFPLPRVGGQLLRLLFSAERSPGNPLSSMPGTASTDLVEGYGFVYGAGEQPYSFVGSRLNSINNNHYGHVLPFDRVALDLIRENAPRDVIILQGLTEANWIATVGSGVTVSNGMAHLVQETLFG